MKQPLHHRYTAEYEAGYQSPPGTVCPYAYGDLGRRCAWLGGYWDRHGDVKKCA